MTLPSRWSGFCSLKIGPLTPLDADYPHAYIGCADNPHPDHPHDPARSALARTRAGWRWRLRPTLRLLGSAAAPMRRAAAPLCPARVCGGDPSRRVCMCPSCRRRWCQSGRAYRQTSIDAIHSRPSVVRGHCVIALRLKRRPSRVAVSLSQRPRRRWCCVWRYDLRCMLSPRPSMRLMASRCVTRLAFLFFAPPRPAPLSRVVF